MSHRTDLLHRVPAIGAPEKKMTKGSGHALGHILLPWKGKNPCVKRTFAEQSAQMLENAIIKISCTILFLSSCAYTLRLSLITCAHAIFCIQ